MMCAARQWYHPEEWGGAEEFDFGVVAGSGALTITGDGDGDGAGAAVAGRAISVLRDIGAARYRCCA